MTPKKFSEVEENNISDSSLINNNNKNSFSEWSEDSESKELKILNSNSHSINRIIEEAN